MAAKQMTIKLMIDTNSNKLIFAEASKDFVDFLIFLLSLPIGTAVKLLTSESMVGSIGNLHKSVANLDETYLKPNVIKDNILNPMVFSSVTNIPLSAAAPGSSINSSKKFYTCWDPECKEGITSAIDGVNCPGCYGFMNKEIEFIDNDSEGYVQNAVSYMISDDLSVTSISTMSIVSMMNKFNVSKLEEMNVQIGNEKALELLKASFRSKTVLTDVFLNSKKRRKSDGERKMMIYVKTHIGVSFTLEEVEPSATVYNVKAKIEDMKGFPSKYLRLLFAGKELHDSRTLAELYIPIECTMHLVFRQSDR